MKFAEALLLVVYLADGCYGRLIDMDMIKQRVNDTNANSAATGSQAGGHIKDGVWTGHDWYDEDQGVGVKNGVPYGLDPEAERRIESARLQTGPGVANEDKYNVRRIMEVFGEEDFEHLFP